MKRISYVALCALSVFSNLTTATENTISTQFKELDKDQDGLLSRSEISRDPALWSHFTRYDVNSDGKLTLSEYELFANK